MDLDKRHKIYGFAIYYALLNNNNYQNLTMDIFLNKINFPFMIIWQNHNINNVNINTIN